MTVRPALVMACLLVVLLIVVAVSARRVGNARDQMTAARLALDRMTTDSRRIRDLRARQQRIEERKRPVQDVIARVNAALDGAGVPLTRFGGLRPHSDSPLAGSGSGDDGPVYRRQTVRINLNRVTIQELGAFHREWNVSQHLWTPVRIDLSHVRSAADPARYNATILVSATYIGEQ